MDFQTVMTFAVSVLPILMYLLVLKALDSFALARMKLILRNVLLGFAMCALAFLLTAQDCAGIPVAVGGFSLMPLVEEILKGCVPATLVLRRKFRFMAQCLIYGAAIGSGFALLENIIYFYFNPDMAVGTAVVRGFGCAILHMGCTALLATLLLLSGRLGGVAAAVLSIIPPVAVHFLYNQVLERGLMNPMAVLLLIVAIFLLLFVFLFFFGEKKIRNWMDRSLSDDVRTLSSIYSGNFASTKAGEYLSDIREHFQPEVFSDMMRYYRLFLEIRISKQSDMLMRQAGFTSGVNGSAHQERSAKKDELDALSSRIGKTGMRVLGPLVRNDV